LNRKLSEVSGDLSLGSINRYLRGAVFAGAAADFTGAAGGFVVGVGGLVIAAAGFTGAAVLAIAASSASKLLA